MIECFARHMTEWEITNTPSWFDSFAYRVRPEPKIETVTLVNFHETARSHRITFILIDGKPDPASIKMEGLA